MQRPAVRLALLLLLALAGARRLPAEDTLELVSLHLWWELEPMTWTGEAPLSDEQASRSILEEARRLVSAMVYGYRFLYVPSDAARGVEERFELEPLGEIPWGDPRLVILQAERLDRRLEAQVDYRLAPHQAARRQAWASNTLPRASGTGEGSLIRGTGERAAALEAALREAVRGHLRPRVFNKPREVRGELLLWSEPRTVIQAGAYRTTVDAKIRITSVLPYRIF